MSEVQALLEKLDGSMVFAFEVAGSMGFGTKAGVTADRCRKCGLGGC